MTHSPGGACPGPDGRLRCPWSLGSDLERDYHDTEWGQPVREERGVFERLSLETFQSGLSWVIILRKRPAFREAFADFDPEVVASFGEDEVVRMLANSAIVRNRRKIEATISNARAVLRLREEGGLVETIWAHQAVARPRPRHVGEVPASTAQSLTLAAALKRAGLVFIGPITCYAMMQAIGMVNDHLTDCEFSPPH